MIVHFAKDSKKFCDGLPLRGGVLYKKVHAYKRWGGLVPSVDLTEYQFIYSNSDNFITCPVCIQKRIDFHLYEAGKLQMKLKKYGAT